MLPPLCAHTSLRAALATPLPKQQSVCMCLCVCEQSTCSYTSKCVWFDTQEGRLRHNRTWRWSTRCLGHVRCDSCHTAPPRAICHASSGARVCHRAVATFPSWIFVVFRRKAFGLWVTSNGGWSPRIAKQACTGQNCSAHWTKVWTRSSAVGSSVDYKIQPLALQLHNQRQVEARVIHDKVFYVFITRLLGAVDTVPLSKEGLCEVETVSFSSLPFVFGGKWEPWSEAKVQRITWIDPLGEWLRPPCTTGLWSPASKCGTVVKT